jgi:hypothetical protein
MVLRLEDECLSNIALCIDDRYGNANEAIALGGYGGHLYI